jgi:hypothetical protein
MNCFKNDASCERILYAIFFYMNRRWLWKHPGSRQLAAELRTLNKTSERNPLELLPAH